MRARNRRANLIYWVTQLKKGKPVSLEEESSNFIRAVEFGLSADSTLPLTADLLVHLHPMVMRSENIKKWITYYQVAARKAGRLSPTVQGNLHNQLGALNWQLGRNASALIQFRNAQDLAKANNLTPQEAVSLMGVSLARWAAHDYRNAFLEARKAVRRFRPKLSGQVVMSQLIAVKGITAYAAEELGVARTSFLEARKLTGWQDLQSQVQFQINLALIDSNEHALYLAEKRLKKLSGKLGNEPNGNRFLGKIELLRAIISQRKGDTEVALGILERGIAAGFLSGPASERAWTESVMGRILLKRGTRKRRRFG